MGSMEEWGAGSQVRIGSLFFFFFVRLLRSRRFRRLKLLLLAWGRLFPYLQVRPVEIYLSFIRGPL